jgi:hypothetical protein
MKTGRSKRTLLRVMSVAIAAGVLLIGPGAHAQEQGTGAEKIQPWVIENTRAGAQAEFFVVMARPVSNTRAAGILMEVSAGNSGSGCSTVADPPSFYDPSFTTGALNTGADTIASRSPTSRGRRGRATSSTVRISPPPAATSWSRSRSP